MKVIQPVAVADGGAFARASTKTCVGANGLLQTVAANVPAWHYDVTNLAAAPILLLEGGATNLLSSPIDFDASAWLKTLVSVTPNVQSAPNGSMTADLLVKSAGVAYIDQIIAFAAVTYTASVFVRASVAGGYFSIVFQPTYADRAGATFNLQTGAVQGSAIPGGSNSSIISADMLAFANGWWRCSLTVACAAGAGQLYMGPTQNNGSFTDPFGGSVPSAAHVWGAQLEVGAVATSFTASSRAPDVASGTAPCLCYGPPENESAVWIAGHSYAVGDQVVANHRIWQCLVANTGDNPATSIASPPNWKDAGTTNRWAPFDGVSGTQQTGSAIAMILRPGLIDSLGMVNISGDSATVCVYDGTTLLYRNTLPLANRDDVMCEWDADFAPYAIVTELMLADLPPCTNAVVSISITGSAGAALGTAVLGSTYDLGGLQLGATLEIVSGSKLIDDGFGNQTTKKGTARVNLKGSVLFSNIQFDQNLRVMRAIDGVLTVWAGTDMDSRFQSLILLGVLGAYASTIKYQSHSASEIEVKGFI